MEFEKLEPEFKAKWVEALRSGKYEQGWRGLYDKDHNRYCCLGVACFILGVKYHNLSDKTYPTRIMSNVIPEQLISNNLILNSLTHKNDGYISNFNPSGKIWSFNEIADWIEENL